MQDMWLTNSIMLLWHSANYHEWCTTTLQKDCSANSFAM